MPTCNGDRYGYNLISQSCAPVIAGFVTDGSLKSFAQQGFGSFDIGFPSGKPAVISAILYQTKIFPVMPNLMASPSVELKCLFKL